MPSDETVSDLPKRIAMLLATACTQGLPPSETGWLAVPVLEAGMVPSGTYPSSRNTNSRLRVNRAKQVGEGQYPRYLQ